MAVESGVDPITTNTRPPTEDARSSVGSRVIGGNVPVGDSRVQGFIPGWTSPQRPIPREVTADDLKKASQPVIDVLYNDNLSFLGNQSLLYEAFTNSFDELISVGVNPADANHILTEIGGRWNVDMQGEWADEQGNIDPLTPQLLDIGFTSRGGFGHELNLSQHGLYAMGDTIIGPNMNPFQPELEFNRGQGGGGGAREPIIPEYIPNFYTAPDRRTIEEMITDKLKILTGKAPEHRVKMYTDMWLETHRNEWVKFEQVSRIVHDQNMAQRLGEEIPLIEDQVQVDPNEVILEQIRNQADYQIIHGNRPSDVDEDQWLTGSIRNARQAGVEGQRAVEFGITNAAGGDITVDPAVLNATERFEVPTFIKKAGEVASFIGSMVK